MQLFTNPLYNALIVFVDIIPGGDVGLAVIVLTLLVRVILFPLSQKSSRTQLVMKRIQPAVEALKKKFKDNPQAQAKETMALYKKEGVNPFAGFLVILIQLPIIFGLYFIFLRGGLPTINLEILYSFVPVPEAVDMQFLGFVDIAAKNVVLALLTGITQFIQINLVSPKLEKRKKDAGMKDDMMRSMQLQMKYVMPVIVAIIAYTLPATIGLYWTTSNLFMIAQELYIRRKFKGGDHSSPSTEDTPSSSETVSV